jgi:hypothetical protein
MFDEAITRLKQIRASPDQRNALKKLSDAGDEVLARYGLIFSPEALPNLTASDFRGFLLFKNNRHWTTLHRQGSLICKDMDRLRAALLELHDTSRPIEDRFDAALCVKYLGKAILTCLLLVMYPDEFGVWNGISEGALKLLKVWPDFEHGLSLGERYRAINDVLRQLRDNLGIGFWLLDGVLWAVTHEGPHPVMSSG